MGKREDSKKIKSKVFRDNPPPPPLQQPFPNVNFFIQTFPPQFHHPHPHLPAPSYLLVSPLKDLETSSRDAGRGKASRRKRTVSTHQQQYKATPATYRRAAPKWANLGRCSRGVEQKINGDRPRLAPSVCSQTLSGLARPAGGPRQLSPSSSPTRTRGPHTHCCCWQLHCCWLLLDLAAAAAAHGSRLSRLLVMA